MKEALKLALEALEDRSSLMRWQKARDAVKEALAQEQEPVAWMDADGNVSDNNDHKCFPIPLYTITHPTPPQRTWVGLTDEEVENLCLSLGAEPIEVRFIEAKLKAKNGFSQEEKNT